MVVLGGGGCWCWWSLVVVLGGGPRCWSLVVVVVGGGWCWWSFIQAHKKTRVSNTRVLVIAWAIKMNMDY